MTTSLDQILDNALRTTPLPSAPANGTSKHQLLDMRVSEDPDRPGLANDHQPRPDPH